MPPLTGPTNLSAASPEQALAEAAARGTVVLAPGARAVRDLRARFDAEQRAAGRRVWTPPRILTFGTWVAGLWSGLLAEGRELRPVLNRGQEHMLWREAIAASPAGEASLQGAAALAEMAAEAYALAAGYGALGRLRRTAVSYDARTFAGWAAEFEARCATERVVASAVLPVLLLDHLQRGNFPAPDRLVMAGWTAEVAPAQQHLLDALRDAGCEIVALESRAAEGDGAVRAVVCAADPGAEVEAAARWIGRFVRERAARGGAVQVALVVPGLAEEREALESTLRRVLAPELEDVGADVSSAPWTVSGGKPLPAMPMAATALDLLRWLAGPVGVERASAVLLSPFVGSMATWAERAELDAFRMRATRRLRPEISLPAVALLASGKYAETATWLRTLARRAAALEGSSALRPYAAWVDFVREALAEAGWPGERELTAEEFAATQAWDHALDSVATLDFAGTRVDFAAALRALEWAVSQAAVTLATGAAVQVMTPSEVPGTAFDALVFLHGTDSQWPAPEKAHPLLPWGLQRDRAMPGTDPAASFERAEAATRAMAHAAANVLFFYAEEDESGAQRLSPVIARLELERVGADALRLDEAVQVHVEAEQVEDTAPLPSLPEGVVRGGARLLQLQAACGFRAFAELRLQSNEPAAAELGMDARESGTFVHGTMERFWARFRTQDALKAASAEELADALRAAIGESVPSRVSVENAWDEAYLEVQKERLATLLRDWLQMELKRGPFKVLDTEREEELTLGPLRLTVRRDRVDETADGLVLVDYKTGASGTPSDWEGTRPDEPQLPLYALLQEADRVRGVMFGKVRRGQDMKWAGFADAGGIMPKPAAMKFTSLAEQVEAWRETLLALAEEYAAGRAVVSPKRFPLTCRRCGQRLLCRLDAEAFQLQQADEVDDAG